MTIVTISEAKKQLPDLIRKVINGERVVIAENNKPIIELHKSDTSKQDRVPNLYKGKVKVVGEWKESDQLVEELIYSSKIIPNADNPH